MLRPARLYAPWVLHHITGRGIERNKIFLTKGDREDFLARVFDLSSKDHFDIHAVPAAEGMRSWKHAGYLHRSLVSDEKRHQP